MSEIDNKFKKGLLSISVLLGVSFLTGGVLLLLQIDALLGRGEVVAQVPRLPEEQRRINELPDSEGYFLRSDATGYQIELFELLVHAHDQFYETGSDENLKEYASVIVRNFVADFFTLSNKMSRTDVGGLQFFSEDVVDNFRNFAIDEFYLYLNQYIDIFGHESLPTVESTRVLNVGFEPRMIELEGGNDGFNEVDMMFDHEHTLLEEEIRTIVVDIEWSYAMSTLSSIDQFQTSARFVLVARQEGIRIYVIELPETDDQYHIEL